MSVANCINRLLTFPLLAAVLKMLYRVEVNGWDNWAKAGDRVLIVANHTSFLDAVLLVAFLPEQVDFVINSYIANRWWLRLPLKFVTTHQLNPGNPMIIKDLINHLLHNKKIMMFPEGRLTTTGALMKIYDGPGMIADKARAMVLPIHIDGAQYSPFSRLKGKVNIRWFPKIVLTMLPPRRIDVPGDIRGHRRHQRAGSQLYDVMSNMMFNSCPIEGTLIRELLRARRLHGGRHIVMEDQRREPMNYAAAIAASFVLARQLNKTCAADEPRIGLMLPNTNVAAIAFFAIQTMGRVVAMLNFTAGSSQLLGASQLAGLKTIITARAFIETARLTDEVDALQQTGIRVLYLEDVRAQINWHGKLYGLLAYVMPEWLLTRQSVETDAAAVVLFTSGSEGTPKGVVLSHRNLLTNRAQIASRIDFGPQDTIFNCLPMFHAFGLTGATLLPLLSGAKVFFYPSPLHYRMVPELVYDGDATILFGTDTFLAHYARHAHPYDFYSIRYVFAGAEQLKEETRQTWINLFGLRILEGYGVTETAPVISVNTPMYYRAGSVGRLLPGIDFKLTEVPGIRDGQRLWVRGANIMLGYLQQNHADLLQATEDGWYDTGDIATIDDEGFVTLRGRVKRFAKIGGEMVSLATVESVIKTLWPNVNHAVVSIPDARKGERLVLLTEQASATLDQLPPYFHRQGLTELSLPHRLIKLDKLPLLGSGKTDYVRAKALALEPVGE